LLLDNRDTINAKIQRGIEQLDRGEGIPEDQLDAQLAKLKNRVSMSARYNLALQAAIDLFEIWRYIKEQTSATTADRVESAIRDRIVSLAGLPKPDTTAWI
jgi:hypothetical protein